MLQSESEHLVFLSLILVVLIFFVGFLFLGVRVWLVECGQAIDRKTLPHVPSPAVTKSPNFWAGTPPPPQKSTTDFKKKKHLT